MSMRGLLKEFVMVETSFTRPLRFLHTKELANLPPPPRRHLFFSFLICRRCRRCHCRRCRCRRCWGGGGGGGESANRFVTCHV